MVVKVNAMSFAHLVKLLLDGTRTADELAEESGLHKQTVYIYTRQLHSKKAVFIADWEQDRLVRDCKPIFMIGCKPDAKRHKLSPAERAANYRARKNKIATPRLESWLHESR